MKNQLLFILYFGLSTLLTWWFVAVSPLYISQKQMLLSTCIAGGKWGIQILAAALLLSNKKWEFLKNIGFVCFLGSCMLIPYIIFGSLHWSNSSEFFIGSLLVAVMVMIVLYYKAVINSKIAIKWWYLWLGCLVIAISLQLTVVFHIFQL